MIRTIGIASEFRSSSVEEVYDYFSSREVIQFDSETEGFDCHTKSLLCIQIGDYDNQWVIHPDYLQHFKPLLEEKTLLGQNIKFDLKFLYKNDIWPKRVWDTFLAESVIKCGLKQGGKNLAAIAKDRLGIDLDKSIRENIWEKGLTKEVIEYAAEDVKHLENIKLSQEKDLRKQGLTRALEIENEFVLCLAYIEYSGFKLDKDKWMKKCILDEKKLIETKNILNDYILDQNVEEFIDKAPTLFDSGYTVTINWNSPQQVIKLFKKYNIPVEIAKGGVKKETVDAKHLEKYRHKFEIVDKYINYREQAKLVSTYGRNFFNHENGSTGRLHTQFKQLMDTGRTSSGSKNKKTKEEYLNFQNIPKDKETRQCFMAEEGNTLIVSDYSSQEQVVLANKCLDTNLLEFFDNGGGDMHSFIASKMYPELKNLSLIEIAEKHDDKRQNAKIAGFTITFGGNELTISNKQNVPLPQAKNIIDSYFGAFPGMKDYFDLAKQEGLMNGYILISELTGRKSYIEGYSTYLRLKKEINRGFWDKWAIEKQKPTEEYEKMKEKISTFFKIKGAIERKSLNFPIQGTAAEISKIGGSLFFKWIKECNYQNKVLIPNFVHDEYVAECPLDIKGIVKNNLKRCMEESGSIYCKRVKLKAEPKITSRWQK